MIVEKIRAEFEAWWLEGVYPLRRMDRMEDAGVSEELAQEIWQASRAAMEIELPSRIERTSKNMLQEDVADMTIWNRCLDGCKASIESVGLKVT